MVTLVLLLACYALQMGISVLGIHGASGFQSLDPITGVGVSSAPMVAVVAQNLWNAVQVGQLFLLLYLFSGQHQRYYYCVCVCVCA